ncbi:MAG: helix-turn-helix transcriptional regulator [Roseburia sp.]|nr:helix-turn-helix transcriptional regulator [Roseburia sp.]
MDYKNICLAMQSRIIQLAETNNLSLKQLSISIGKSPDYIHKVVSEKITPTLPVIVDICNQLGITLSDLFDETITHPIEYNKVLKQLQTASKEKLDAIFILLSNN